MLLTAASWFLPNNYILTDCNCVIEREAIKNIIIPYSFKSILFNIYLDYKNIKNKMVVKNVSRYIKNLVLYIRRVHTT